MTAMDPIQVPEMPPLQRELQVTRKLTWNELYAHCVALTKHVNQVSRRLESACLTIDTLENRIRILENTAKGTDSSFGAVLNRLDFMEDKVDKKLLKYNFTVPKKQSTRLADAMNVDPPVSLQLPEPPVPYVEQAQSEIPFTVASKRPLKRARNRVVMSSDDEDMSFSE